VSGASDLVAALECSDLAAEMALRYFQTGVTATIKSDGSPVTEADCAVELMLHDELQRVAPDDAVLGEEFGVVGESERVWILDPIDGTSFFSRGNPHWRVHVALQIGGRLEVAVVTAPAIGLQWWARRGQGAFESSWPRRGDEKRLEVSTTNAISDALLDADEDEIRTLLLPKFELAPLTALGWCTGLIRLVRGEVDAFLSVGHQVWDHAPWMLLVEEAGGRFTKRSPKEMHGGGLYSNGVLHNELLVAIG
jgi:histidinol-phosphatase